jgi:hypothetical protein
MSSPLCSLNRRVRIINFPGPRMIQLIVHHSLSGELLDLGSCLCFAWWWTCGFGLGDGLCATYFDLVMDLWVWTWWWTLCYLFGLGDGLVLVIWTCACYLELGLYMWYILWCMWSMWDICDVCKIYVMDVIYIYIHIYMRCMWYIIFCHDEIQKIKK